VKKNRNKITKEMIIEMKAFRDLGASYSYLSCRYNIHESSIYYALNKHRISSRRNSSSFVQARASIRDSKSQDAPKVPCKKLLRVS
jgi:hypothetical protein